MTKSVIFFAVTALVVIRATTLPWDSLQFVSHKTDEINEANSVAEDVALLITNQLDKDSGNRSLALHNYQRTGYAIATTAGLAALVSEISSQCNCSPENFSPGRAELLKQFFKDGLSHAKPDEALILYSYALDPLSPISFSSEELSFYRLKGEAILQSEDSIYHHMRILNNSLFGLFGDLKMPKLDYSDTDKAKKV